MSHAPRETQIAPVLVTKRGRDALEREYFEQVNAFIPRIGTTTDAKTRKSNYQSVLEELNDEHQLGLSTFEIQLKALMAQALDNIRRFKGDPNLTSDRGGNSGEHPFFALLRAGYFTKRAGVDASENSQVKDLIRDYKLGALLHDDGEMLAEFGTVASQARGAGKDIPYLERSIYQAMLNYAAWAVENGEQKTFLTEIAGWQQELNAGATTLNEKMDLSDAERNQIGESLTKRMAEIVEELKASQFHLSSEAQASIAKFLHIYDTSENIGGVDDDKKTITKTANFIGTAVKNTERSEGNSHLRTLANHVHNGENVGLRCMTSEHVRQTITYQEENLGALFTLLDGHDPEDAKAKLARTICAEAYRLMAEGNFMQPKAFDRFAKPNQDSSRTHTGLSSEPIINEYVQTHLQSRAGKGYNGIDQLHQVETSARIGCLYAKAAERVEAGEFIPQPKQVVGLIEELPPELYVSREEMKRYSSEYSPVSKALGRVA